MAVDLSNSADKRLEVPAPGVEKKTLFFSLPWASRSWMVLMPLPGCTTSSCGLRTIKEMGTKSFSGSCVTPLYKNGLVAKLSNTTPRL